MKVLQAALRVEWEQALADDLGGCCMVQFLAWLGEHLAELMEDEVVQEQGGQEELFHAAEDDAQGVDAASIAHPRAAAAVECPAVFHGSISSDRKSKFQGHVARVTSLAQVRAVRASLLDDRRIACAAHPVIAAWRIEGGEERGHSGIDGNDDDGEGGASQRLLFLLQRMDLQDVVVFCTRWFGGVLLGPVRFKHITNAVKAALDEWAEAEKS